MLAGARGTGALGAPAAAALPAVSAIPHSFQRRTLFSWNLRPYAYSAAAAQATGLSTINGGFSKVSLSLLIAPWKALPAALFILPMAWAGCCETLGLLF